MGTCERDIDGGVAAAPQKAPPGAQIPPTRSRGRAAKRRLVTLEDLDKRCRGAQLALDTYDRLLAERGGREAQSVLRHASIRSAAVLVAMIEDAQSRWLAGEDIEPAELATLINCRRREAEAIGLDPLPRDVTPDLREYLAADSPAAPASGPPASQTGQGARGAAATLENESSESAKGSTA